MTDNSQETPQKSGIVTLIGRSNVGKSTLLNALVGFKIAPVSPKAQMTRMPTKGILTEERGQVVFVDTPGLFMKKPDQLTRELNKHVGESMRDVDALLYVVDPTREIGSEERRLLSMVRPLKNKILVINKMDIPRPNFLVDYEILGEEEFEHVVKVSAKSHTHLKTLTQMIFDLLPEGEPLYPEGEDSTEQIDLESMKTWVAEMIREKIFNILHKEVPYAMHVEVEHIETRSDGLLEIHANILTA